jgi:hypothetical protein
MSKDIEMKLNINGTAGNQNNTKPCLLCWAAASCAKRPVCGEVRICEKDQSMKPTLVLRNEICVQSEQTLGDRGFLRVLGLLIGLWWCT